MRRGLLLALTAVPIVLFADANPAHAHGGHDPLQAGISSSLVIVLYCAVIVGAVAAGVKAPAKSDSADGFGERLLRIGVFGVPGQIALIALLVVALLQDDPFGTVGRLAFLLVFMPLIAPPLGALWFRGWPHEPRPVIPLLPALCLFGALWHFLVFPRPTEQNALSMLLLGIVLVSGAATHRIDNPFGEAYARLCGGLRSSLLVTSVALGAVVFAILREQPSWAVRLGEAGDWANTAKRTMLFVGCILSVFILVRMTALVVAWLNRSDQRQVAGSLTAGVTLITVGVACAVFLPSIVTAVKDQLFVLWDPFDEGWTLAPSQGLSWNPDVAWVDRVRVAALVFTPAFAVFRVVRSGVNGAMSTRDAVPVVVAMAVAGAAGLYYVVL